MGQITKSITTSYIQKDTPKDGFIELKKRKKQRIKSGGVKEKMAEIKLYKRTLHVRSVYTMNHGSIKPINYTEES